MTAAVEILPSFEPGSPEWIAQRARRVGGSEIAAVLGLSKWHSRFSLWHQKAGRFGGFPDSPVLEWGRRLEDVIAGKWQDEHPDLVLAPGGTVARTDRPYQIATPDRIVLAGSDDENRRLLEIKTQRDQEGWGEPGSDEIPVYYRAQSLWYMDVLDIEVCDFAVLIGGSDYREYRVAYDQADAERMRTAAQEFIASLDTGERPPIDGHDATYQTIRETHPEIEPVEVELPAPLARAYCTAKQAVTAADVEARRQTALVADFMGSAQRATFLGTTIARRQSKNGGRPYVQAATGLPDFGNESAA